MPLAFSKSGTATLELQTECRTDLFRIRSARRGDAESIGGVLRELGYADGADAATVHWVLSHPEMEIFVATDARDPALGIVSMAHRPPLPMPGRLATLHALA